MYFLWLICSFVPVSDALTNILARHIPTSVAMLTWAFSLILAAVFFGPLALPASLWIFLYALFLVSLVFLPLSFRSHSIASIAVLVLLYVEVYWLLPKWQDRRNHSASIQQ
jgi:hypothetical protein